MSGPSIARRLFLFRGAAATTGAALLSLSAAAARSGGSEDTELLVLGRKLEQIDRDCEAATEAKHQALARYEALCPIPDDLVLTKEEIRARHFVGRDEKTWDGDLVRDANDRVRQITTADDLRGDVEDYGPRTKIGRLARRKLKVAEVHEKAKQDAEQASGLWAAHGVLHDARRALDEIAATIMEAPVATFAGVAVKAKAVVVHGRHLGVNRISWVAFKHGPLLADDILAVAASQEALS